MYKEEDLRRMDRARLRRLLKKIVGDAAQGFEGPVDIANLTVEELVEDILFSQEFTG